MFDFDKIKQKYNGFKVVGDIHGNYESFMTLVEDALNNNLYLISLGDLVDRGSKSPEVLYKVVELMREDLLSAIVGNHDDRFWRYLNGNPVHISDTLGKTINQFENNNNKELLVEFYKNMPNWPIWATVDNYTFVHGAFHPVMMYSKIVPWIKKKAYKSASALALYGLVRKFDENNYPVREHDWIENIPENHTVIVGHEYLDDVPVIKTNSKNGTAIFLDTGSEKGGSLTGMNFYFT